jgi:hypothetical protein
MIRVKLWRCRSDDKINGIGKSPIDAYKDWESYARLKLINRFTLET